MTTTRQRPAEGRKGTPQCERKRRLPRATPRRGGTKLVEVGAAFQQTATYHWYLRHGPYLRCSRPWAARLPLGCDRAER
jgi:hypothetical protein